MAKRERREPVGVRRNEDGELYFIYSLSKDEIHDMYKRMDAGPKTIYRSTNRSKNNEEN
mgnify:CR=1 FL=1|jgi:hypothetical protein